MTDKWGTVETAEGLRVPIGSTVYRLESDVVEEFVVGRQWPFARIWYSSPEAAAKAAHADIDEALARYREHNPIESDLEVVV